MIRRTAPRHVIDDEQNLAPDAPDGLDAPFAVAAARVVPLQNGALENPRRVREVEAAAAQRRGALILIPFERCPFNISHWLTYVNGLETHG
jgi:hypothetical protein